MAALAECYVQGVSTRKVAAICEELFGDRMSHETVSRYAQELDAELQPWRERTLEGALPYLILDARYEKARVDHRIVDVAVLVAVGVSETGHRHVVDESTDHGEAAEALGSLAAELAPEHPRAGGLARGGGCGSSRTRRVCCGWRVRC